MTSSEYFQFFFIGNFFIESRRLPLRQGSFRHLTETEENSSTMFAFLAYKRFVPRIMRWV